jgi:hypothetical protein
VRSGPSTVGREVRRSGSERFRKHRRPCGQPAVEGEIGRFRPVPPQAGHCKRIKATPSDLPFKSTGFATYPLPPQLGQSLGATPLPPQVEDIVHDASTKFSAECFALRITNKISRVGNPKMFASRVVEPRKGKAHDNGLRRGCIALQRHAADRNQYICLGEIRSYTASGNLVRY